MNTTTSEETPNPNAPAIEDSLNAALAALTITLLRTSGDERSRIERRIADLQAILDRRHW